MGTCSVRIILILALVLAPADSERTKTSLYTIKKFDMIFSKDYFRDVTAFYLPVKGKWGRISINVTVAREIDSFWLDFSTFRQDQEDKSHFNPMAVRLRVDICDIAKYGADGILFRFIDGLYPYVEHFFQPCPIGVGTQMLLADRTLPSVPRRGQGPIIPTGYYKFTFDFRNDRNASLAFLSVEFQYRGY